MRVFSEVTDFYLFAHFFKAVCQFVHDLDFDAESDGQIRVLVSRIDRLADEEVNVRCVLEQHLGNQRSTVRLQAPHVLKVAVVQKFLGILHNAAHRYDAFRHEINPFYMPDRRNVGIRAVIKRRGNGLVEIIRCDFRRRAAADDFFAFFGEEESHHFGAVLRIGRGAEQKIDRRTFADADRRYGRVVTRLAFIQLVALVNDQRGDQLGRERVIVDALGKFDDVFPLPSEIHAFADTGINGAVAHGDENVMELKGNLALKNRFPLDYTADDRILHALSAAQENHVRVVELDDLGNRIVGDPDDCKSGIGDLADAANGKRLHNGIHAFLDRHAVCHHRADDFAGERGQDIGFDAAAEAVGQNHCHGVFIVADDLDAVTAQLFSDMVQTDVPKIGPEIVHFVFLRILIATACLSAVSGQSWFRRWFHREEKRFPVRRAFAFQ